MVFLIQLLDSAAKYLYFVEQVEANAKSSRIHPPRHLARDRAEENDFGLNDERMMTKTSTMAETIEG